ncbi:MAG: hypothetical protein COU25_01660 [Candidatus Levybacteria bacterium CG10_big_fil_rev_8_21_14_0_10_35_13]|nr:MAG: hypothetical protein COU25_01660 [Candidatus Levybacteria bacterium CG10_big_fil_rev_8_21_14_0_10_35_13]
MNIFKKLLPFAVIVILSYFSYKPLLGPGFFPIHDDTQVARVYEMTKSLKDGLFPVRWVEDLGYGYGYPIFNYYNPFPYYLGGFLGLFGIDALLATKTVMLLGILLSGFTMFILARQFWDDLGGILAALFYVYAPYHAVDIYIRGDIAEFWAYAFIPLVFYGLWKTFKEKKFVYVAFTSIIYALLIASHNLTAMMVSPFLLAFVIYLIAKNKKELIINSLYLFSSLFLGIIISAFYWFPALLEINFSNVLSQIGGGADFRDHFVCLPQLWTSIWGYGGSVRGCTDGVSFMIGKYHILTSLILFTVSVIFIFWKKNSSLINKEKDKLLLIIIAFAAFLTSVFFTLELSGPLWEFIKPMEFFQFPWRFLLMASFFSSFISGGLLLFVFKFTKNINLKYIWPAFIFLFIVSVSLKFFVPQIKLSKESADYTSDFNLKWTASRISDEYMPKNFIKPKSYNEIKSFNSLRGTDIVLQSLSKKTQEINLELNVLKDTSIIFSIAYFPSWKAYVDSNPAEITNKDGQILIKVKSGLHKINFKFVSTPVQTVSNLISIAGILAITIGIIYSSRKHE